MSWVATSTAAPAAARRSRRSASSRLRAWSMPRVGSSSATTAGGSPPPIPRPASTMPSARRWRAPPGQVARVALHGVLETQLAQRRRGRGRGQLVADALVQEVVGRSLQQQRDLPGRAHCSRGRARAPRPRCAAACSCPRRCGPAARRSRRAPRRATGRAAPRRRRPCRRRTRPTRPLSERAGAAGGVAGGRRRVGVQRPWASSRQRARAPPSPSPGSGRMPASENMRAAGGTSSGRCRAAHSRNAAGRPVAGDRAVVERDHAVGGRKAALEAVLAEQDGRPPLLVQAPQLRQQLLARDRVELRGRLVQQQQPRARRPAPRRARRAAAPLPTACATGRSSRPSMPSASAASSTARAAPAPPWPRLSSDSSSSARTPFITSCDSGSWNTIAATSATPAGPCSRVSRPQTVTRPGHLAAEEVRHEAARRAHQRRLAAARHAGQHGQLTLAPATGSTSSSAGRASPG